SPQGCLRLWSPPHCEEFVDFLVEAFGKQSSEIFASLGTGLRHSLRRQSEEGLALADSPWHDFGRGYYFIDEADARRLVWANEHGRHRQALCLAASDYQCERLM